MKRKNGFTLIEIMVVIVIMGILAAVGVPKLFGAIAKAKASEIHTAVGTYIHAQDAYLHGNNAIGSWKEIGFSAPHRRPLTTADACKIKSLHRKAERTS